MIQLHETAADCSNPAIGPRTHFSAGLYTLNQIHYRVKPTETVAVAELKSLLHCLALQVNRMDCRGSVLVRGSDIHMVTNRTPL